MFETLRDSLKGVKVYILCAAAILVAIIEGPLGWDLPGVDIGDNWLDYIWTALTGAALRAGIAKVEHKV